MSDTPGPDHRRMYVGYLPLPARLYRPIRIGVPILLWVMVLIGVLVVYGREPAGGGTWDTSVEREWTGTLFAHPYPMLIVEGPSDSDAEGLHLLVGVGKFGIHDRAGSLDGQRVVVRGFPLVRDGRRMIEVLAERKAEPEPGRSAHSVIEWNSVGEWTGVGEIVDGKCFLGAMKPGDGRTHRACAQLCIRGGLPPMLAVPVVGGGVELLLVTGPDGAPMDAGLLEHVGLPVRVRGQIYEAQGLRRIELLPAMVGVVR